MHRGLHRSLFTETGRTGSSLRLRVAVVMAGGRKRLFAVQSGTCCGQQRGFGLLPYLWQSTAPF